MHKMTFCKKKIKLYDCECVCIGAGVMGLIQEEAACLGGWLPLFSWLLNLLTI